MRISSNTPYPSVSFHRGDTSLMPGKPQGQEDLNILKSNPVKVTISEEGKEKFRSDLVENEKITRDVLKQEGENLKETKIVTSHVNVLLEKIQKSGKDGLAADAQARDIFEAYASEYDKIVKGYQDGSRVCYVSDPNSETGYRQLTKEEDLQALDDAYKQICDGYEEWLHNAREAEDIVEKDYKKRLQYLKTSGNRGDKLEKMEEAIQGSLEEIERSRKARSEIPENIGAKLKQAGQQFLAQYRVTAGSDAQSFHKMVSNINIW